MRGLASKLRSRSGESFAEVLVAILVIAMAALLMASMVTASGGIDINARNQDKDFYAAVTALETVDGTVVTPTTAEVKVTETGGTQNSVNVNVYSKEGLIAYEVKP